MPDFASITVLGIESSCDDTAASILRAQQTPQGLKADILSNVVFGQDAAHAPFGGVVPEIAARAHVERLDDAIRSALHEASVSFDDIGLVAATAGPGLIGGVLAGVVTAKAIGAARGLPVLGINHLEGHALTPRLTHNVAYPYLLLLASGGHCQLISVDALGAYTRLGGTIDDSPGEAFDKVAKHLGLGFPGGPQVQSWAEKGDARRFKLPRPLMDRPGCDMSFSGLKTALRLACDKLVEAQGGLYRQDIADLCAGFQAAVADALGQKTRRALKMFKDRHPQGGALAVAGGVAANTALRAQLQNAAQEAGAAFIAPPLKLCTDNAAMIAWAAAERWFAGETQSFEDIQARPRWPLDANAHSMLGGGKRGPKA